MKKFLIYTSVLFLILIICFFAFRNSILSAYLDKKIKEFNSSRHAELIIGHARFSGWFGVQLNAISLKEEGKENFLTADTVEAKLNLFELIKGHLAFRDVYLSNGEIKIVQKGILKNYSFLFQRKQSSKKRNSGYKEKAENILKLLFDRSPENLTANKISLDVIKDSIHVLGFIKEARKKGTDLYTEINTEEKGKKSLWKVIGTMNNSNHSLRLKFLSETGKDREFPYIKEKYGITLMFDSLTCSLTDKITSDQIILNQSTVGYGVQIHHWRISSENVKLP